MQKLRYLTLLRINIQNWKINNTCTDSYLFNNEKHDDPLVDHPRSNLKQVIVAVAYIDQLKSPKFSFKDPVGQILYSRIQKKNQ